MSKPRIGTLVLAASAGNALEFYDFTVFGYFAPQIAAAFFPAGTHSLAYVWGGFATAFVARPLGAIVLGSYADRGGRKAAMTASILLMTLGTLLLAVMPRFSVIGWAAPLGMLVARVLQGFAAGGEFGGATAFMLEHAKRRRGLMASYQFTSQAVSTACGAAAALATSTLMPPAALAEWGFRLPFLAGLLIGPVGLYLRRHAEETPVFLRTTKADRPGLDALMQHPGRMALAACTIAAGTSSTYAVIYLPTYAQTQLHMAAPSSFLVPLVGAMIALVVTPAAAMLSDRVGRFWPAMTGASVLALISYPAFLVIDAWPSFAVLMLVIGVMIAVRSGYSAGLPALMGEMFPPALRGVGMSIGYSLGVMVFGGTTPLVNTWLIETTHNRTMPGIYLALCGVVTVAALAAIARTVKLHTD